MPIAKKYSSQKRQNKLDNPTLQNWRNKAKKLFAVSAGAQKPKNEKPVTTMSWTLLYRRANARAHKVQSISNVCAPG